MDQYMSIEIETFKLKENLKECLNKIGGTANIKQFGAEFNRRIDLNKFGAGSFRELLKNFNDIFCIERDTISLKNDRSNTKDKSFEIQDYIPSMKIDESNESLLNKYTSSSNSTSYKEIQNSFKIPLEQRHFTGGKKLSNSETSEDSEKEYQKIIDKAYGIGSHNRNADSGSNNDLKASVTKSSISLEGLSSASDVDYNFDKDDLEEIISKGEFEDYDSLNEFISSLPIDDEFLVTHLPPQNRDPNATVPLQEIDKNFDDKIIFLSEIFDPVHFWFQFVIGDEKFDKFETFHCKFNDDYKKLKERELAISDENFKEGLIVAAYLTKFKRWYRARIVNNYNNERDTVRLFFIDYGTNGTCRKSCIKYIFQYFMKYPQYCFRGRIHGIVPINNERHFKINDTEEFIKKISHHSFVARSIKYEPDEDVYELDLIRRKDELNMKEYLLEKKFAQEIMPGENDGEFSIGPPCILIPSFRALEKDYPTYAELEYFCRADVNFDIVIDTNYLHNVTLEEVDNIEDLRAIVQHPKFAMTKKYFYKFS